MVLFGCNDKDKDLHLSLRLSFSLTLCLKIGVVCSIQLLLFFCLPPLITIICNPSYQIIFWWFIPTVVAWTYSSQKSPLCLCFYMLESLLLWRLIYSQTYVQCTITIRTQNLRPLLPGGRCSEVALCYKNWN